MRYTLYYTFNEELDGGRTLWAVDYAYDVEQRFDDILRYLYEQKFDKKYSELAWYLEPGAKEAVKGWESAWIQNDIKSYDYYTTMNYPFIDWLKEEYYRDALADCLSRMESMSPMGCSFND